MQLKRAAPVPPTADVIQRCHHCNNNNCTNGEICGHNDPSFGSLLNPTGPTNVGPYSQTKKHSQKGVWEAEHMFSGQMAKEYKSLTGTTLNYNQMPAYRIDYTVHQQGRYGTGKGISSTGGSKTSKDWAKHIAQKMANNPTEGLRLLIVDALNAHSEQGKLSDDVVSSVLQTMYEVIDLLGLTISDNDIVYLKSLALSYLYK